MSSAALANRLGQTVLPGIAERILPDTMTIRSLTETQDDLGGTKKASVDAYELVPVSYKPLQATGDRREESGNRLISIKKYRLSFPTHKADGTRIDLDSEIHRLVVNARGNEPVKTFKILSKDESAGVMFYAICEKED